MDNTLTFCKPFIIGGMSGMTSTCIIQPIDVIKTTIQLRKNMTIKDVINSTWKTHGVRGFYSGLTAALLRQSVYTTTRMGLYSHFSSTVDTTKLSNKIMCGMSAGAIGALVSTPTDLILTRMQADNSSLNEVKYRYRNVFHGLSQVYRTTGLFSLWKGAEVLVPRAILINGTLLPSYQQTQQALLTKFDKDDLIIRTVPSVVAGVSSAAISQPFDIIKAHIQSDTTGRNRNVIKAVSNIISNNGITGLYRGFPVYITRIAPHGAITTFLIDTFTRAWSN